MARTRKTTPAQVEPEATETVPTPEVELEFACMICGEPVVPDEAIAIGDDLTHDTHSLADLKVSRVGEIFDTFKRKSTHRVRPVVERIPASDFAAGRDGPALSNKEVAAAIGKSMSRVSELTTSQGASRVKYDEYVMALVGFAAEHPRPQPLAQEAAAE